MDYEESFNQHEREITENENKYEAEDVDTEMKDEDLPPDDDDDVVIEHSSRSSSRTFSSQFASSGEYQPKGWNPMEDQQYVRIRGSAQDRANMDALFSSYKPEQWNKLAEKVLKINISEEMDERSLIQAFQLMYNLFCYKCSTNEQVISRIGAVSPDVTVWKDRKKTYEDLFQNLVTQMSMRKFMSDGKDAAPWMKELRRDVSEIACAMRALFDTVVDLELFKHTQDVSIRNMLYDVQPLSLFRDPAEMSKLKDLKPHQRMIYYYYRLMWKNRMRIELSGPVRHPVGTLYKPKFNAKGQFVHAYERDGTVSEFVFKSMNPITLNLQWFNTLTDGCNTASTCIDHLTNFRNEFLPVLERNRNLHAFQNGVYDVSVDRFYHLDKIPGKPHIGDLTGNPIAVNYHNQIFDEQTMEQEIEYENKCYREQLAREGKEITDLPEEIRPICIKLKELHTILSTQQFNTREIMWIYGLMGRMLHEVNALDQWSVVIFFLGLAGTGKTTCLKLISSMYEMKDVGYLNNNLQEKFALEGIYDKLIYLAMDVDEHFRLDQATFQSMSCGEPVVVQCKFKTPFDMIWKAQGAMAGNKLPPWQDQGGNLQRRLFVIEFVTMIPSFDPSLYENCLAQKDRMLKVWNMSYHILVRKYKKTSIKSKCPPKFTESEKRALMELNPLVSFVDSCCTIDRTTVKTSITQLDVFVKLFRNFCRLNAIKTPVINSNFLNGVFAKWQIETIDPASVPPDKAMGQNTKFLLGLAIKDHVLQQNSRNN